MDCFTLRCFNNCSLLQAEERDKHVKYKIWVFFLDEKVIDFIDKFDSHIP